MSERAPDMSRSDDVESRERRAVSDKERDARSAVEEARARADIAERMDRDRIASDEEAARLAAVLRRPKTERIISEPDSKLKKFAVGAAGATADTTMNIGGRVAKRVGYGISALFTWIEQMGHDALKKSEKYWKWIPFVGPWLAGKPEKTWEEQDKEWDKKQEAEKKKRDAEAERKKKLKDAGFSEEQIAALKTGPKVEDGEKPEKEKPEKPEEEKAS